MSFVGVTFAGQKVTPSADALLMQRILSDGITYGCSLDYAGFTVTMSPGWLVVCGRNIEHPASENWAVIGATSGYARGVLTIDLSKSASVDSFDQISFDIDYASTPDGFAPLEKAEINASGTKYQAEVFVASLSSGGVTGIVRSLPLATPFASADVLAAMLADGYLRLGPKQIVNRVEDIPADAPEGAVFFVPVEE